MAGSNALDAYRKRASFEVAKLKQLIEPKEIIEHRESIWETLARDPLFFDPGEVLPDEYQKLVIKRNKRLVEYNFSTDTPAERYAYSVALFAHDVSNLSPHAMFLDVLKRANRQHFTSLIETAQNYQVIGCFALTEIAHGSNSKGLRTTATYDPATQGFIIHSPDIEAAKCWVGNLGKVASYTILFAQLCTPDGAHHGVHQFLVPVRDTYTLNTLPGVIAGDMGAKLGMNGVSNGFVMFNHYWIPRENLIPGGGEVTPEGHFVSPHKDVAKQHVAMLAPLSAGRVTITSFQIGYLRAAISTAIRYSACRRQFGPTPQEELPVLEYQLQQWRLFPYLAAAFVWTHFCPTLFTDYTRALETSDPVEQASLIKEVHALSCGAKAMAGFIARDGIQESREACGGHGYLAANQFGSLRGSVDSLLTAEGDNNLILFQTAAYILGVFAEKQAGGGRPITSPLGSLDLLDHCEDVVRRKFVGVEGGVLTHRDTIGIFEWLLCYLCTESFMKLQTELSNGKDGFIAREDCQVYHCHTLAQVYTECFILKKFAKLVDSAPSEGGLKAITEKLCTLYGLSRAERHVSTLYQGSYFTQPGDVRLLRTSLLHCIHLLKDEVVALVDALAPPDHILRAPIGLSNGEAYKNLFQSMVTHSKSMERPHWWEEVMANPSLGSRHDMIVKAKL
eukprot:Em0015g33a